MMDPLVGQVVDGYRILDELGRGGMGIVYKVENVVLKRTEALKIISRHLLRDAQFLRRFRHEAQALAQIQHPNIVTVYTMRESALGHYLTMEHVEGHTLADHPIDPNLVEKLDLIKQLLSAFAFAHERGIIHRDIKPSNIMLTPDGIIKVMDFGLAKFYLKQDVTQSQGVSGTLRYMSPEQIRGRQLDQRSDLFSLGITIYEMLSGRLPYNAHDNMFDVQRAIVEDNFQSLSSASSEIPEKLSDIVMKALEKDPDMRYHTADEMLEAIRACEPIINQMADNENIPSQSMASTRTAPVWMPQQTSPETEHRRFGRSLTIAAVLVLIAVGVVALSPTIGDLFSTDDPAVGTATSTLSGVLDEGVDPDASAADSNTGITPKDSEQSAGVTSKESTARESQSSQETNTPTEPGPVQLSSITSDDADDAGSSELTRQEQFESDPDRQSADPDVVEESQEETSAAQNPVDEPQNTSETSTASIGEQVTKQAPSMADELKNAILADKWSGLPEFATDFYQKKLRDLPRKFDVKDADVVIDASSLKTIGTEVTVPVTVYLTIQQKGREGTEAIPLPTVWTWRQVDEAMKFVDVQDR